MRRRGALSRHEQWGAVTWEVLTLLLHQILRFVTGSGPTDKLIISLKASSELQTSYFIRFSEKREGRRLRGHSEKLPREAVFGRSRAVHTQAPAVDKGAIVAGQHFDGHSEAECCRTSLKNSRHLRGGSRSPEPFHFLSLDKTFLPHQTTSSSQGTGHLISCLLACKGACQRPCLGS